MIVPLDVGVKGADSFIRHNFVIASSLAKPYYIGFWSTLNYYGFSEQIPRTTFVATTQIVKPLEILDSNYYFVELVKRKFFGIKRIEIDRRKINISGPDKTMVDCLDHLEHCGGIDELARAIYFSHQELKLRRMKNYAVKMNNVTVLKRLGYILDKNRLIRKLRSHF
ncbi:MAG: type IV toxin-antitoxin system AbiEi family antitoxin [bacterium]